LQHHVRAAGLPTPDDKTFCPINGTSCYFWSAGAAWSTAQQACINRGGYLVSHQSYAEQLQVRQSLMLLG
jgi:hypothetical protein